jgi:hypothetical protein
VGLCGGGQHGVVPLPVPVVTSQRHRGQFPIGDPDAQRRVVLAQVRLDPQTRAGAVAPINSTLTRGRPAAEPRQFMEVWLNSRCSMDPCGAAEFLATFGPRRLRRRQSQPDLVATEDGAAGAASSAWATPAALGHGTAMAGPTALGAGRRERHASLWGFACAVDLPKRHGGCAPASTSPGSRGGGWCGPSCCGNASVLSGRVGSDRRSQPGRVGFAPAAALA